MSADKTSAKPIEIADDELSRATCLTCLAGVWWYAEGGVILDREEFRGMELLGLHPCAHPLADPEELDDPDWGWVEG